MSHFNEQANEWDTDKKIAMMDVLAKNTLKVLKIERPLDIMDFGCGTGLFGLGFVKYAKSLVGVDTSEGMLEVFKEKTTNMPQVCSIQIDLENEKLDKKFDLIVSSMTFHHLNSPIQMIQNLRSMLAPRGRLAIVDLCTEDGTFHAEPKEMGVKHFGFSDEEIESWAKNAEMNLHIEKINTMHKESGAFDQFLAVFSRI
jgi:SAM-dependent methyltransferase